jgi:hypothetical protein
VTILFNAAITGFLIASVVSLLLFFEGNHPEGLTSAIFQSATAAFLQYLKKKKRR